MITFLMNNLEPRAKIGDVVIVMQSDEQLVIYSARQIADTWQYKATTNVVGLYTQVPQVKEFKRVIMDDHILKNLTTNVSYE